MIHFNLPHISKYSHNVRYRASRLQSMSLEEDEHLVTIVESEEPGYACPCHGSINGLGNSVTSYALPYIVTNFFLSSEIASAES